MTKSAKNSERMGGILLPITALPSPYGIGGLTKEAYDFVDRLQEAGQKIWQVLPIGPTGFGDSPYQSFSTFAGNPYFIALDALVEEGLLTEEECAQADCGQDPNRIDYGRVFATRFPLLRLAFSRFDRSDKAFLAFKKAKEDWLPDYTMYMAIRTREDGRPWMEWPEPLRMRDPDALLKAGEELADEIDFFAFQQFCFDKQWRALKDYANKRGIGIMGDIPFYVAMDSAGTWGDPRLYQFDEALRPRGVAGVPPDAFSADGQLWGNPLYDWAYHKKTKYAWWIRRMRHVLNCYDIVRIDHFRGFEAYYSVPYGDATAANGHWEEGPGLAVFKALKKELGELPVVAEDLGFLTEAVHEMVDESGFPGMKVLQFAFDDHNPENDYLPHRCPANSIIYTGTHDNDTTRSWFGNLHEDTKAYCVDYLKTRLGDSFDPYLAAYTEERITELCIRAVMSADSRYCVIPMQDYLNLGGEARMNLPSTLDTCNWSWRMLPGAFNEALAGKIRALTEHYGR